MSYTYCKLIFIFSIGLFVQSCASFDEQISDSYKGWVEDELHGELVYSMYLIGDAGNASLNETTFTLKALENKLKIAGKNSTALFLGDNIYPVGMPSKKHKKKRALAEHRIKTQTDILKDFNGTSIFIPGNHDWYSNGLNGLEREQKFIEKELQNKNVFFPQDGCPLEKIDLTDDLVIIAIDSQWYLEDWNKHPTMNDNCPYIKSKRKFFEELKGMLNKNSEKTVVIALHHPVFTNGTHGGKYSAKSHLFPLGNSIPLPGVGSFFNLLRETSGLSPQDLQNKNYSELANKIVTLSQPYKKVVFVSGHDHNLQFLKKKNKIQIVSGSASKKSATKLGSDTGFTYGHEGYSQLNFYKDGSAKVVFYGTSENAEKKVFQAEVFPADKAYTKKFPKEERKTFVTSIYSKEQTDKSFLYKLLWGDHYRRYYSKNIEAPIVLLDTLFGGLTPVKKGGGNQSNSIRLEDKTGKQYVMRALKKSATRFLQSVAFQEEYVTEKFEDTYTEDLLLDFYTSAHPFTPFVVDDLSKPLGIYHTNPNLYYIPKQDALQKYNEQFGNQLYMIEERAASGHGNLESFGFADKVISTDDLFKNLRKSKDYTVDEPAYVRARLFDLLIGDWDRHADQWRWAEFKEGDKRFYRPVPRDRDQAFSNYDGLLLTSLTRLIPSVRLMQTYDTEIRSIKWFSDEPYPLDLAFLQNNEKAMWLKEAKFIQDNLTDEIIDHAFEDVPEEVKDESLLKIKNTLKYRRAKLLDIASYYNAYLLKFVTLKGTDKDDWFEILHKEDKKTVVQHFNIKNGEKGKLIKENIYDGGLTKEIWIYGLDDDDHFVISGDAKGHSKIKLIGGQNKDTYVVNDNPNVKIHDFKSKKNKFQAKRKFLELSDRYTEQVYDYRKIKKNVNQLMPSLGLNPDDGLKYGFLNTFTHYGFLRNPFTYKHAFGAMYYNATEGFELTYNGEFATSKTNWNLGIESRFTSPNYSINFFEFGNETENKGKEKGKDYNRVKLSTISLAPSFIWKGFSEATFKLSLPFEAIEIEETEGRITSESIYERAYFAGMKAQFSYSHYDNISLPTLGFAFDVSAAYSSNLNGDHDNSYVKSMMSFVHKLNSSGKITLSTKLKGHLVFQDEFEIYQAASIGGADGLRGFRNQRFTGKNSFYQNTDIRFTLKEKNTALVPVSYGVALGYDYGKVWMIGESSTKWHAAYGGSLWLNANGLATGNLALFSSEDGLRVSFGIGFGF
ncbi:metallophosphoesterase [Flavicella sediminum]|uniref:metallophosphoesterase n=1 Tax=Flavicella sediminum TaxID=2585141 RepID=UPI0011240D2D|nr:metallophosphoesterase [Flavicella sediminum]